jgi:hypothetical protein
MFEFIRKKWNICSYFGNTDFSTKIKNAIFSYKKYFYFFFKTFGQKLSMQKKLGIYTRDW